MFRSCHPLASLLLVFLFASAPPLLGLPADRQVDDDLAECPAAGHTTIADALAAALPGDVIEVCAGTYTEPQLVLDKQLEIFGAGVGVTIVESSPPNAIFLVVGGADDISLSDMTLRNASVGLRFEEIGQSSDNVQVTRVHFTGFASRAVEIHNQTSVQNLTFDDCRFDNTSHGIRGASSSTIDGLTVTNSIFEDLTIGIYQANDGSTSTMRNLLVSGTTFRNHTDAGIFVEEVRDASIRDNMFESNNRGIVVFKNYTSAGVPVENLSVTNNQFVDHQSVAFLYFQLNSALVGPVDFVGNTIIQNAGLLTNNFGLIDVRLDGAFVHGPVRITDNDVTFGGTLSGTPASAAYAVKVRGSLDAVTIQANTFDGGNIGALGGLPPTAGIYFQSDDAGAFGMGPITPTSDVEVFCNDITGFVDGIAVYDPVAGAPGGLPPGALVTVQGNQISGNSSFGLDNSGSSETILAELNWWGDATGPSGQGAGSGDAVTLNVDFTPFLLTPPTGCSTLLVDKTDSVDPVLPGMPLEYTITVTNQGPLDATGVVATDVLPAGLQLLSTSGCAEDPAGVPTCSLGDIPAATGKSYTVATTVSPTASGVLQNTVSVGAAVATEQTQIVLPVADLGVVKEVVTLPLLPIVGDRVTYRLTVENFGTNAAPAVVVEDLFPAGLAFVSSPCATATPGGLLWSIGVLAPGQQVTCESVAEIVAPGRLRNVATVAGNVIDSDPTNDSDDAEILAGATTPVIGIPLGGPIARLILALLLAAAGLGLLMRARG